MRTTQNITMMHHKKDICIPGYLHQSVRPEYDTMHHRKDICIPGYVDSKAYDPEYNSDAPPYETLAFQVTWTQNVRSIQHAHRPYTPAVQQWTYTRSRSKAALTRTETYTKRTPPITPKKKKKKEKTTPAASNVCSWRPLERDPYRRH